MDLGKQSAIVGLSLMLLVGCASSKPVPAKTGQAATDAVETALSGFERVCLTNLESFARLDSRPAHAVMRQMALARSGWVGDGLAGVDGAVAKLNHPATGVSVVVIAAGKKATCFARLAGAPLTGVSRRVARSLEAQNRKLVQKGPSEFAISGFDNVNGGYGESSEERAAEGKELSFGVTFWEGE